MPVYGESYWTRRAAATARKGRALTGAHHTDVVIVGGGFTGCATAHLLAQAGLKVMLVERATLASGATRHGMGIVSPSPDAAYTAVAKAAGPKAAKLMYASQRRAARELAATLSKLRIKCDQAPSELLVNAPFTNDAALLKKESAARKAAGLDAAWMAAAATRERLATETQGGMRLRDVTLLDPVKAALGFAAIAQAKGVRIVEHAEVKKTTFTRKDVTVVLKGATITARGVVVATGEPGVFDQLERHVRTSTGYVAVTDKLPAAMRSAVGARDAAYTEFTESPRWLRWLPDGRAMFAGLTGPAPAAALRDKAIVQRCNQLMYELSLRYPDLSGLPLAWGWDLPVVTTADGLPWIGPHRNYPFHFFALAFGWHGDAGAWLSAQAAARFFTGKATKDDALLGFARAL